MTSSLKWKHFPRNWPFVRGIHRSPVNSSHKGQWRGALMFSLICVWINDWVNNREAGDLRRYRAHYDVIVMGRFPSQSASNVESFSMWKRQHGTNHSSSVAWLIEIWDQNMLESIDAPGKIESKTFNLRSSTKVRCLSKYIIQGELCGVIISLTTFKADLGRWPQYPPCILSTLQEYIA